MKSGSMGPDGDVGGTNNPPTNLSYICALGAPSGLLM